ncbi:MAG: TetR/AcrR family transcriptional regulator C-terminal domain-containing protein [Eubacteriales bacterium]|nr:TetR/AcrR family transcriptional regulator C-terminal domain-containing protein [Eubacteriales bacterium]MDD3349912.1 TetR/AcrR family transcriptional regulator C-terminal domain-containing protein [Eubacteriales bacterium]
MSPKSMDRRVKYTIMMIKKSFISILKEKPIAKITIKQICEEADINRATFYAHFKDQYDLLQQIEDGFLEDIKLHLASIAYSATERESVSALERIIGYIKENAEVCSLLLSDRGNLDFHKRIMMIAQTQFIAELKQKKELSAEDAEYIFLFITVGSVGITQKWIVDGMKRPAVEIAQMIFTLTEKVLL